MLLASAAQQGEQVALMPTKISHLNSHPGCQQSSSSISSKNFNAEENNLPLKIQQAAHGIATQDVERARAHYSLLMAKLRLLVAVQWGCSVPERLRTQRRYP